MSDLITIAVPKGYLLGETVKAFEKIGIHFPPDFENSRRLFTYDLDNKFKLLIVRPWDVPAYVEQGAADLGVVGKDVLEEQEPDVFDLKDLGFGGCSLVIAGFKDQKISDLNQKTNEAITRVRTSYQHFTL
jgi:ATP phosphoribosyltransferase